MIFLVIYWGDYNTMPKLSIVLSASADKINTYVEDFLKKTDGATYAKWQKQKDEFMKAVSSIKVVRSKKPAAPYAQWCKSVFKCTDPENRMKQQGAEWKKWKEDPKNKKELARMKKEFETRMSEYNANKPENVQVVWKQDKKHQVKDPNAPRKMTSYMFFCAEQRSILKDKGVTQADMMKELGNLWKNLSETKKERYNQLAVDSKAKYDESMKSYVRPTEQELLDAKNTKKEKVKESKKPRGKTAYNVFYETRRKEILSANPEAKGYKATIDAEWKEMKAGGNTEKFDEMANLLKVKVEVEGKEEEKEEDDEDDDEEDEDEEDEDEDEEDDD